MLILLLLLLLLLLFTNINISTVSDHPATPGDAPSSARRPRVDSASVPASRADRHRSARRAVRLEAVVGQWPRFCADALRRGDAGVRPDESRLDSGGGRDCASRL